MPRLVTKFRYLNPSRTEKRGGFARYIGSRDGVELVDDSYAYAPATKKQLSMIKKILRDIPSSVDLPEYNSFTADPNYGNASGFISRVIEVHREQVQNQKTYASYIATRPGAQRYGAHGLFTDEGKVVKLAKVAKELNAYKGKMWTAVFSLKREDAERLGFDEGERWKDLLRAHKQEFSDQFHIPMQDLKWYAAFHNESHHPHCHLIIYAEHENEGYLSKEGVAFLRASLAQDIFAQDLICEYQAQTESRDMLRSFSRERIAEIVEQLNDGTCDNAEMNEKLIALALRLSSTGGKKVYGYLPADAKELVDSVVDALERDERIAALYDQWYMCRENVLRTYTDSFPQRLPLRENPEFRVIKNTIIREAMKIVADQAAAEEEATEARETERPGSDLKDTGQASGTTSKAPEAGFVYTPSAAMGTLRIMQAFGRIAKAKIDREQGVRNVDRKLSQKIKEKKEALGMKQG